MKLLCLAALLLVASSCSPSEETTEDNKAGDFYSFMGTPRDRDDALKQLEQKLRERDEVVRRCMAEQGFEYFVLDPSERLAPEPGFDLSEDKYAAEFGFGITTGYSFNDLVFQEPMEQEPISPFGDLPDNEIDVFFAALDGQDGCAQQGDESMQPDPEIIVLLPEVDEMFQRIRADPRVVAIEEEALRCVAGKVDLDGSDLDGAIASIQADLAALDERWAMFIDNSFEEPDDSDSFEEPGPPMPTDEFVSELSALQAHERRMAVAVYECNEIDIVEYGEIEAEYQAEFLTEHQG